MPDKLIFGVYSSGGPSGALQLAINHVTERGTGDGYRLAGPSVASGSQKLLEHTVSEEDAAEIRRYLDAVFPQPDARRWAELKEYLTRLIEQDSAVHRDFLEAGDMATAAPFGGLISANRSTLAKMRELEAPGGC